MVVSKDEAAQALAEIGQAEERASRLRGYRYGAPYVLLWGVLWMVANTAVAIDERIGGWVWWGGVAVVMIASAVIGSRQGPDFTRMSEMERSKYKRFGQKWALTGLLSWAAPCSVFAIFWPSSAMQYNASLLLIWMFVYMIGGIWVGWRLFWIGFAGAAAILGGYFLLRPHFILWSGLVGGGAMIAGGLWMRKA